MSMFFMIWVAMIVITIVIADQKRLSVLGFFFLSLFFGPLAILIALLSSPGTPKSSPTSGPFTLAEARRYLSELKSQLASIQQKINTLESRIDQLGSSETPAVSPTLESAPDEPSTGSPKAATQTSEGFEQVFGKYWLSRIGVILFVIGIGLFISYTFQYLNAWAKIGIGYLLAAGFFVWGRWLEINEKYTKIAWGILGGAWGLLYLSTYAMHFIPATRVIIHPFIEIILLALVSLAAIYYNLKYNSWIVTAMTFSLAFITAGLGGLNFTSVIYFSLLVACIAYLSFRMRWHFFLVLGIVASYITHACWINSDPFFYPRYMPGLLNPPVYQFQIMFSILLIAWAIYAGVLFVLKQKNESDDQLFLSAQLLNAGFFISLGLFEINKVQRYVNFGINEKFWFLTLIAIVYFGFAYIHSRIKRPRFIVSNVAIAFALIGMAIFIRVPKLSVTFYWILEMLLLFAIGIYYKERIYRVFAALMSIMILVRLFIFDLFSNRIYLLAGIPIHKILLIGFAALCFYGLAIVFDKRIFGRNLPKDEKDLYPMVFPIFGTLLLTFLLREEMANRWLSVGWTSLGTVIFATGFWLKNRAFRLNALCVLCLAALRVIFIDMSGVNTIYKIMAFTVLGALLLGISMIYSKYKINKD